MRAGSRCAAGLCNNGTGLSLRLRDASTGTVGGRLVCCLQLRKNNCCSRQHENGGQSNNFNFMGHSAPRRKLGRTKSLGQRYSRLSYFNSEPPKVFLIRKFRSRPALRGSVMNMIRRCPQSDRGAAYERRTFTLRRSAMPASEGEHGDQQPARQPGYLAAAASRSETAAHSAASSIWSMLSVNSSASHPNLGRTKAAILSE